MNAPETIVPARRRAGEAKKWASPAIYVAGAGLAAWIFYEAATGQLGADPVRGLEQSLGLWALRFLILGLAISPLRRLGGPSLIAYRRAIGLLAFFFAALHIVVYAVFDLGGDVTALGREIAKRPYITIGMLAFAILVPLAVTSNDAAIRRLGGERWRRLHSLVFGATALVAVHFIMSVKAWPLEPLIYAAIVAALIAFRAGDRLFRARKKRPRARTATP